MAPSKPVNLKKKKWSEVNKTRKEEKRKWREKKLMDKREKAASEANTEEKCQEAFVNESVEEPSTISMGVPGSILENAQSPPLRTYLAGQIARAATIFQVDEIVIFDDYSDEANAKKNSIEDETGIKTARQSCVQLGRILQYLECPQYLRKHFFPMHKDLSFSGVLNPLNAPHHLGQNDVFEFREGVVTNKPVKAGKGSIVNVGLLQDVHVDKLLPEGVRCTVRMLPQEGPKKLKGVIVSPSTPRKETGIYWGYTLRIANSLSHVFSQCTYKEGYDLTIGTSDKGDSIDEFVCPQYKHLLVMFGGVYGLEMALENDTVLNADNPSQLFDHYLNTLPDQGSKTIRTEEAVLVTFAALRPKLNPATKLMKTYNIEKKQTQKNNMNSSDNSMSEQVEQTHGDFNRSDIIKKKRKQKNNENLSDKSVSGTVVGQPQDDLSRFD